MTVLPGHFPKQSKEKCQLLSWKVCMSEHCQAHAACGILARKLKRFDSDGEVAAKTRMANFRKIGVSYRVLEEVAVGGPPTVLGNSTTLVHTSNQLLSRIKTTQVRLAE